MVTVELDTLLSLSRLHVDFSRGSLASDQSQPILSHLYVCFKNKEQLGIYKVSY